MTSRYNGHPEPRTESTLTLHKKGGKCAYKPLQLRIILSFMGNIRCHLRWPLDFA